jgi:hypothetical protein
LSAVSEIVEQHDESANLSHSLDLVDSTFGSMVPAGRRHRGATVVGSMMPAGRRHSGATVVRSGQQSLRL